MPQQTGATPNGARRMDPTSPKAARIPRPASTDTFFSEREVINMLEELQDQKQRAESQVSLLHNRIENLQSRLDIMSPMPSQPSSPSRSPLRSAAADEGARSANIRHNSRAQSETGSVAVEVGSLQSFGRERSSPVSLGRQGSETLSAVSDAESGPAGSGGQGGGGEEEEGAAASDEVEDFVRLRRYVQHMQEGASLLLWREEGLQLCWFWVDAQCLSLNWDIDEGAAEATAGDSLLLERVLDIVPLGAGPDQLTEHPTDSSFTILFDDGRLDLVAPTSLDFQVWYFGLAFATRLRLNALSEANASPSDSQNEWPASADETRHKHDTLDESSATSTQGGADGGSAQLGLSVEESHALLMKLEDQRKALERLQRENQMLKEVRHSKDEAISRLLHDLQMAESARESETDEAKTPATSMESDRNFHHRELFRVRRRNQRLLEILELKQAAIEELWALQRQCLAHN